MMSRRNAIIRLGNGSTALSIPKRLLLFPALRSMKTERIDAVMAPAAIQILKEGEGDGYSASAVVLMEEKGVRHLPGIHHPGQGLEHGLVSLYLSESHLSLSALYSASPMSMSLNSDPGSTETALHA